MTDPLSPQSAQAPQSARPADVRARLKAGLPCIGAWQTLPSAKAADAMASCGFHWLAVDLEHATISLETAEACFIAAERNGVAPLVRLPSADPYLGRRLLDAGALGLIVPVVEDAEAFSEFASHCFYTPEGRRGAGLSRCNGYGDRFEQNMTDFRPLLIPQIETRKGVAAAADLAALAQVDGLFLGPYDLSADLGTPGNFTTDAFAAAAKTVKQACDQHGKAIGIHQVQPDAQALADRIEEGYRFIAYSTDVIAMRTALGRPLDALET